MDAYRGTFGAPRPAGLERFPPSPLPGRRGLNPLKAWRYVGVYGDDFMICAANVRVGPIRQSFYAVWDRRRRALYERTGNPDVRLEPGRVRVVTQDVQIDLEFAETAGIEVITGDAWTRKQAGIAARGRLMLGGEPHPISARAVIDDSAGYHDRHTWWRWSAGVGVDTDGRELAWNLTQGIHPRENTVWVDGEPHELEPPPFATDLSRVGDLRFSQEAVRARSENRLLVRSRYRQPFGTFSGQIGGHTLAQGFGVMEEHDVYW